MSDGWYMQRGGEQVGPVGLEQVRAELAGGGLEPQDQVWQAGWPAWRPAGEVAELRAGAAVAPRLDYGSRVGKGDVLLTPAGLAALRATRPWVLLFAVLAFIGIGFGLLGVVSMLLIGGVAAGSQGGAAAAITVVIFSLFPLAFLALYFFPALFLAKYAAAIGRLGQTHAQDDLEAALVNQKSFWKFLGVCTLVAIGLYVLMFVAFAVLGVAGSMAAPRSAPAPPAPPAPAIPVPVMPAPTLPR